MSSRRRKRIVAARMGNGHIGLIEEDTPPTHPGTILVEVYNSLVSPGTELGGWHKLREQLENPNCNVKPRPFGYSNAGIIVEIGEGVKEFKVGDRVACIGFNYALHTNYAVVPQNLCILLPEEVTFAQGSYAMIAATALNTLRRGEPEFGEYTAVVGLGLVGQLTAMFYQLAGNFVIGWDIIPFRIEIAQKWGIDATTIVDAGDEVGATKAFTNGHGLDAAIIAFGGNGDKAREKIYESLKCSPDGHLMGRIVIVGAASMACSWSPANVDIRVAARTGPGYHDEEWELGRDYPPVYMRWTTRTNLEICMRMIAKGKLTVDCLTTHTIPLEDVDAGISAIIKEPDRILGVIFKMKQ